MKVVGPLTKPLSDPCSAQNAHVARRGGARGECSGGDVP